MSCGPRIASRRWSRRLIGGAKSGPLLRKKRKRRSGAKLTEHETASRRRRRNDDSQESAKRYDGRGTPERMPLHPEWSLAQGPGARASGGAVRGEERRREEDVLALCYT